MKSLASTLIKNLQKYFEKNNISKAIVGISGGADSALTATIAAHALGAENILALRMPHKDFSSEENLCDAREVCDYLNLEVQEIEISSFCNSLFKLPFATKTMTKGNIMARIRMILLYALANENNGIVLGTGNKTEILTGFFTKYGDGGVDIEVLGELWKTEVFALAEYFGLPKNVYTKSPTAELFLGQTDEEELGISYPELDKILEQIITTPNFSASTHEEQHVLNIMKKSAHKRGEVPVLSRK